METLTKDQYMRVVRGFVASRNDPIYWNDDYYHLGRRIAHELHRHVDDGLTKHGYYPPCGKMPQWSVLPPSQDPMVHAYLNDVQRQLWRYDQRDWLLSQGAYADR